MSSCRASRIVHLELHTADISSACGFYSSLLRWRVERISAGAASYHALEMGRGLGGGVVECGASHPLWLPYVEVDRVDEVTERARRLGASVLLEPCEGPAGWRSVVSSRQGGEIAFWQPKRRRDLRRAQTSRLMER